MKSIFYLFLLFVCTQIGTHAATLTASQTGDYEDPATWGGVAPTATDDVVIPVGFTVTLNTTNGSCLGLNVAGTLVINPTRTLAVGGSIANTGIITINGTLSATNSGASYTNSAGATTTVALGGMLTLSCALTNAGTMTVTGTLNTSNALTNNNALTVSGTLAASNAGAAVSIGSGANLSVSSGGTMNLTSSVSITGTLTNAGTSTVNGTIVNNGTFTNPGTFTANASFTSSNAITNAGSLTCNALFSTSNTFRNDGTFVTANSFSTSSTSASAVNNTNSMTIGGTFNITSTSATFTNSGTLTINSGATVSLSCNVSFSGIFNNGGNTTIAGTTNTIAASLTNTNIINFIGTTNTISNNTNNSGTITFSGTTNNINGATQTFTNQTGGTLIIPINKTVSFGQNLNNAAGGNIQIGGIFNCVGTSFIASSITITNNGTITSLGSNSELNFNYTLIVNFLGNLTLQGSGSIVIGKISFQVSATTFSNGMKITGNSINATTVSFTGALDYAFSGSGNIIATTISVGSTKDVTFGGNRAITSNVLNVNSSGNVSLTVNGDISISTATLNSGSSGSLTFGSTQAVYITNELKHSGSGTLSLNSNPTSYNINNLTIASSAGTRTFINKSISLTGSLNLSSGHASLSTSVILYTPSIIGGSSNSYVITSGAGSYLQASIVDDGGTLPFPIGTSSSYTPLTISPNVAFTFGVRVRQGFTTNPTPGDVNQTIKLEWDVQKISSGAVTTAIIFHWNSVDQQSGFSGASAYLARYSSVWTKDKDVTNVSGFSARVDNLTLFGTMAIFSLRAIPVTLSKFTAQNVNNDALLEWTTIQEINNKGFEIERSFNAVDFRQIGYAEGAGNSKETHHYRFVDPNVTSVTYYRLKQVDFDGQTSYTRAVAVVPSDDAEITLYPNPSSGGKFSIKSSINILGWKIRTVTGQLIGEGNRESEIKIPSNNRGLFLVEFITDQGTTIKKIWVE
ncbi:MAG: hypothetical protein U0Y10_18235 [Spirosomataceae bacterium]